MRLVLLLPAACCALLAGRPSDRAVRARRRVVSTATGDRWYEGCDAKYPRGARDMPPSPPVETGGGGHASVGRAARCDD